MIFDKINNYNQLIQEREVIRENVSQISKLSDEFTNLADLRNVSSDLDLTSYQINILSEKRINLRNHIVNLKDGLQVHFGLGEEIMRPLIGLLLLETLLIQHGQIIKKLSDIDAVILNLSPMGILFNSIYLKHEIDDICLVIYKINCQESSLLAFSGICRDEEPV